LRRAPLLDKIFTDAKGKNVTYDLKPDPTTAVGTSQVADAVVDKLKR